MSTRARIAIVAIAAVGLVIAFFGARGSDDQDNPPVATTPAATSPVTTPTAEPEPPTATTGTPPAPAPTVIEVAGGKPKGGVAQLKVDKGDTVRFVVESDTADEIHVHGYDLTRDVPAGGRATFKFEAKLDGRFEVELEGAGVQIARLDVQP